MWLSRRNSQKTIETQSMQFRQWSVCVQRKAFRRSISIILKPDAPIIVKAGLKTPDKLIEQFLLAKEFWIEKHLQKFSDKKIEFPEKKLLHAEVFPFLGKNLSLKLVPTPLKKIFFSKTDDHLLMHIPMISWNSIESEELQQYFSELKKFYLKEAEKLVPQRLELWSQTMQLYPRKLSLRNQKSRWGSCSSRGTLNINWRLMGAPIEILDYILVHELSHLKHMNHSTKFWELVEKHYPEYQKSEKWLKEKHELLKFLE